MQVNKRWMDQGFFVLGGHSLEGNGGLKKHRPGVAVRPACLVSWLLEVKSVSTPCPRQWWLPWSQGLSYLITEVHSGALPCSELDPQSG